MVVKALSNIGNLHRLLEVEKRRRGVDIGKLVFIGMADTASFTWCAMKSLLTTIEMEPHFFASYLHDRLLYTLKLGHVKKLPKTEKEILLVGDQIAFDDVERLLKDSEKEDLGKPPSSIAFSVHTPEGIVKLVAINPSISPEQKEKIVRLAEKRHAKVVNLEDAPPKFRGEICQEFLAERYHTIRWNFEWENYVVVGVPDGITSEFVYEFKTTGSEFLLGHMDHSALAQADLYGYFFKRRCKRVQIYIMDEKETVTWHEDVDEAKAVDLLTEFKKLVETSEAVPPQEKWKCKSCEFRKTCQIKST